MQDLEQSGKELRRRRRQHRSLSASLLLLGSICFPALMATGAAQQTSQEPLLSPLVQREEVRFIILNLVVEEKVGRKWRLARDLHQEQVTVLLGGSPVEIDSFENDCRWAEPAGGEPPATARRDAEDREGSPVANAQSPRSPNRYILYFDLEHLRLEGLRLAFMGALEWAEQVVSPIDEVMIVIGGSSLRIARPMLPASRNLAQDLQAALKDGRGALGWADGERARNEQIQERYEFYLDPRGVPGAIAAAEGLSRWHARQDFSNIRRSLANLVELLTLFDSIEGTKNLVFFGETVRQVPGHQYIFATDPADATPFLRQLSHAANERNVRIYPVAAGGGVADSAFTFLASETGGRVTERTNRMLDAFTRIGKDASCFYLVGFQVVPRDTGTSQRISVRIRGEAKNYRVRHRRTLDDPTAEQQAVDAVSAAFLNPRQVRSFPVSAAAYPLAPGFEGGRIRLEVAVQLKDLLALPGPDGKSWFSVELGAMVFSLLPGASDQETDEGGAWVGVDEGWEPWRFARKAVLIQPSGSGGGVPEALVAVQEIRAPPGPLRIVAVVRDLHAGTLGAGMENFHVPKERPVLCALKLAAEDVRSVMLGWQQEVGEVKGRKRIVSLEALLPERALLREEKSLRREASAFVVYSLCDPGARIDAPQAATQAVAPVAFKGWTLTGTLDCGAGAKPTSPVIPHVAAGDSCALVVEPIPSWELSAQGNCRYQVTLDRPGSEREVRDLSFRVRN